MGCDIHGWVEIKDEGKWIATSIIPEGRNYRRFAMLAGVRGEGPNPALGIPNDISETAQYFIKLMDGDDHSHSYMDIEKAADIFIATEPVKGDGQSWKYMRDYPYYSFFDLERYTKGDGNARIVFWFDN